MTAPSVSSRRAFTLIELLVVISIIAILLTLLFPAADAAFEAARRAQAKNDASQIANAITAYLAEYGKLPIAGAGGGGGNINDEKLMNILAGATPDDPMNPRGIVFLEIPKAKAGKNGAEQSGGAYTSGFKDSWAGTGGTDYYEIRVDDDYDNVVTAGTLGEVRKSVVVWSQGNPKKPSYTEPAKWIKSWE